MRASRWTIAPPRPDLANAIADATGLDPLLAQVLANRGIETPEAADAFLDPDAAPLPSPLEEFPDLPLALDLLADAIAEGKPIAICGDYDADGMTSTALLLRALRSLGATADYAIPSRMTDGYGINCRIVEEFHRDGVGTILTVDNGIAAVEPIALARDLGMTAIVTDHHDVPPVVPPAHAILNPKLIREDSPYRGLAGVGVAYVLAVCLARHLKRPALWRSLLELFTLGTIADLAPLTGVNRRWVQKGLSLLPHSQLAGVRALQQVAGVALAPAATSGPPDGGTSETAGAGGSPAALPNPPGAAPANGAPNGTANVTANGNGNAKALKPEAIGFRLGPRINAVGRIGDPDLVIQLLTADDPALALERAMQCEQINLERQRLCAEIEREAIAQVQPRAADLPRDRVLVVVREGWHHGTIGIVASRLVERFGAPTFIGTYEDEARTHIRGSARGIPEFDVFAALEFCKDLTEKHGGHRAAGGFSLRADRLDAFVARLQTFGRQQLATDHICPLVEVDVQADFDRLDWGLYEQIDSLQPCGIGNPAPVFWTPNLRVVEQQAVGKGRAHLKLKLAQGDRIFKAIAWRWGSEVPLPERVDAAYRLQENEWRGQVSVELEVLALRPAAGAIAARPAANAPTSTATPTATPAIAPVAPGPGTVAFQHARRTYRCSYSDRGGTPELRIRNGEGNVLAVQPGCCSADGNPEGLLGRSRDEARSVDLTQPFFRDLIAAAWAALAARSQ